MAQLKNTTVDGTLKVTGNLTAANFHPVGDIVITRTNENPASKYGGTWKLIDKEFKPTSMTSENNSDYFTITKGIKSFKIELSRAGHSVRLRFDATISTGWWYDSNIIIGTFNFPALGFKKIPLSFFDHPGGNEQNHSVILADLVHETAELQRREIVRFAWKSGNTVAGDSIYNSEVHWDFPILITNKDDMIDSFCDKFYWERTA